MKTILTFHSIDDSGSVLSYSPDQFAYLLNAIRRKNVPIIDMATLLAPTTREGVVLTFDDGMESLHENALPILKEYDACAHVFITTDAINQGMDWPQQPADVPGFKMLTWDQIEDLQKSGVFIDAHTRSHPDMRQLSAAEMADECGSADDEIARRTGRQPEFFAYPFGYHNRKAREFCRSRYSASVTTELRHISSSEDNGALPRIDTYYIRTQGKINHLGDFSSNTYLRIRWLLRTLRGSHCVAGYDDER